MKIRSVLSELEAFAKQSIAAQRYPRDYHIFTPFKCGRCGFVPLEVTLEHHTNSKDGNFRGEIFGLCSECGSKENVFSFTRAKKKRLREEKPVCQCGHDRFLVWRVRAVRGR